jgi:hypothetical protein
MNFNLDTAIETANQVVHAKFNRYLTDLEIIILEGAWQREEYDLIAAKHQYSHTYISQDIAPKLWQLLTESLGEKVRKSNFKEALKRYWEKNNLARKTSAIKTQYLTQTERDKQQILTPDVYVERPPIESICYETILQPGASIRIKAPSLMGKTYLMNKILARVATEGYRSAILSFELADRSTHLTNLNKFLRWFCLNISRELGLASELDEYWDEEGMGSKVSCTTYFEEYLLTSSDSPLVLCLDDVDVLFAYPEIYEDFFGLLRSWYEKARSRAIWQKLRLILVHTTDVYIRLNINQSPFNVGLPVELPEFTIEQVCEFARMHQIDPQDRIIQPLIDLVGGHPYLLNRAFCYLKSHPDVSIEQLLAEASTEAGIYSNHLREFWLNLQDRPELTLAFKKAIGSTNPIELEPVIAYQLQSMGLVTLYGNQVQPRCQLYRQYFGDRLA